MSPIAYDQHADKPLALYTNDKSGEAITLKRRCFAGLSAVVGNPSQAGEGLLVVIDGTTMIRRMGYMMEKGELSLKGVPLMLGVDSQQPLKDYSPYYFKALRQGADDFGGGADVFLDEVLVPLVRVAQRHYGGRCALMGYSLATLLCLQALMRKECFSDYLLASPSSWFPGFVDLLSHATLNPEARVVVACGRDEGAGHPQPLRGLRGETDRMIGVLTEKLHQPPTLVLDDLDHHRGLLVRVSALLRHVQSGNPSTP